MKFKRRCRRCKKRFTKGNNYLCDICTTPDDVTNRKSQKKYLMKLKQVKNDTKNKQKIEFNLNRGSYINSFGVLYPEPFIIIKKNKNET